MRLAPFSTFTTPRVIASAILLLGGLAAFVLTFPGELEDDSFTQLVEGRRGIYSFWHAPIMSWMLGISDALSPGAAYFVAFDFVLAFVALAALFWLGRRVSWAAVAGAAVVLFLPQLFLFQATVWKDALFADACLVGFVCLAHAAAHWPMRRLRFALIGSAALFLALAVLARQNGAIVLFCAAVTLGVIAAHWKTRKRIALGYGAALLLVSAVVAFAANAALELRSDGTPATQDQFKTLETYDIAGMLQRHPDYRLTMLDKHAPKFARLIRGDGVRLYSPMKNDTLEYSLPLIEARDDTPAPVLAAQWRALALAHPASYLALRAEIFGWLFLPTHVALCHPYHVGAEGDADDLRFLGMKTRFNTRDETLGNYAMAFVGTPVFAHVAYAAIGLIALVLLLRRRRPADLAMAGLLAASFLFTLSFFVISIACDYRYLYLLDLSAIAAVLYMLCDWPKKKGGRSPL